MERINTSNPAGNTSLQFIEGTDRIIKFIELIRVAGVHTTSNRFENLRGKFLSSSFMEIIL